MDALELFKKTFAVDMGEVNRHLQDTPWVPTQEGFYEAQYRALESFPADATCSLDSACLAARAAGLRLLAAEGRLYLVDFRVLEGLRGET
jgi:hypothetical protein